MQTMSTPLTADTITDKQIEALRTEAAEHGDWAQVAVCDVALSRGTQTMVNGVVWVRHTARSECARVINDAAARHD